MVTHKQIAALKYLIAIAKDGSDTAKKIMFFLLDRSEELTKEVCITLTQDTEGYTREEIGKDAHSMNGVMSGNRTTHLDEVMDVMGTDFSFSVHYGNFIAGGEFDTSGMFAGFPATMIALPDKQIDAPMRYTYWLAKTKYSKTAGVIPVSREELESINLDKPGLYPILEEQRGWQVRA